MSKYILIAVSFLMIGCGNAKFQAVNPTPDEIAVIPPEEPGPVVEDALQKVIDQIIEDENDFRVGSGLSVLSPGLSCKLYTITGGSRIQSTSGSNTTLQNKVQVASYTHMGVFNQETSSINDGMNVLPSLLRGIFKNMYYLQCVGSIVITESDFNLFELTSDDASLLYINNSLVVDNDNAHGPTLKSGQRYLKKGVHTIRLDYAQTAGGQQALILEQNGDILPSRLLFH
jgi:hypothetical protein